MNRTELGGFVRAVRRRAGMRSAELAKMISRSETWLYRLEHGARSDPLDVDLDGIARACALSRWEQRYLYLLADRPPTTELFDSQPIKVYMDTIPQPTAWLTCAPDTYHNPEFLRLFKDADQYRDMTHWHFEYPDAHRIVDNWEEIADWWVATGRLRAVTDPHDRGLARCLELNLANPEVRARWESQVIPVDPSSRTWYVNDIDNGVQLAIDMRVWRHPYRNGMMLTGFFERD